MLLTSWTSWPVKGYCIHNHNNPFLLLFAADIRGLRCTMFWVLTEMPPRRKLRRPIERWVLEDFSVELKRVCGLKLKVALKLFPNSPFFSQDNRESEKQDLAIYWKLLISLQLQAICVYKYTKIQVPWFQRNNIIVRYQKSDLHGMSFQSPPKINRMLITRPICVQWRAVTACTR